MTGHILVVEDNPITRKMMCLSLEVSGFTVAEAGTARDALASAAADSPMLILQDMLLPDMDGLALVRLFRDRPETRDVPIIAVSGLLARLEEARTVHAGFTDYLFKPVDPGRLRAAVARVLAPVRGDGLDGKGRRLLLVDDDDVQRKLNRIQLQSLAFEVTTAADGAAAIESARARRPDIIVSDLLMPGMSGIELCLAIRKDPDLARIPLVLASSTFTHIEDEDRLLAAKVGANAFVVRTPGLREVVGAIRDGLSSTAVPALAVDAMTANEEYVRRLMRQLDHQATVNTVLLQRTAMDAALLSIAGAAAQVTAKATNLDATLHEVLALALDAGGVSSGGIYLLDKDGRPELRAMVGRDEGERQALETFFGHADLLARSVAAGLPIAIPSASIASDVSHDLLTRARADGLLIAPLVSQGVAYGALVVSASSFGMTPEWLNSTATVAAQLAQTVALSKTINDLTASERALAEREERFCQLADNVADVFYVMDGALTEVLYVNPAYEVMSGRSRQSLYDDPRSFLDLILPEDREAFGAALASLQHGVEVGELEFRVRRADGSIRWVLFHSRPVRDAAGNVYRLSGTARDVTEHRQTRLDLEESVVRYQKLSEAMYDAVAIAQDGVYREVNPGFVRMFGYDSVDEVVGRHVVDFVSAKSREEVATRIANGIEGSVEIECVRKDGKKIICEVTSREHTLNGKPARIAALRDVTDQRSLQAQFRQAQKMEAVGRLAGGVAHDFNNLLTVIMGNAEILTQGMMKDDPRAADLEQIRKAADGAAVLTRQLLTFSRQQVVEPRTVVLGDVIAKTQRMLGQLIGEDIKITTQFTEEPCSVHIDPGQIEQVIMNLAVNARDAMPTGGMLTIETSVATLEPAQALGHSLSAPGRYALLAVSDNGTGMDKETADRAFEPFFTTKEQGKGTGLGLATVYGIVKQNGGSISVYSEPGMGTTFRIHLPLVDANGAPGSDARDLHDLQEAPRGTETVLLVEDSVSVREVTRRALERHGYSVLETTSATEALIIAQRPGAVINLLLTDVVMPQMSGRVVAEGFRVHHPSGKVLYMSGYTDDAIVRHGVLNSGTPYLQKPFTSRVLACKVREVLDA